MGMILVTASVAVFVWAVVGLIRPTWARLPSRAASVGVWFLSVVLFHHRRRVDAGFDA